MFKWDIIQGIMSREEKMGFSEISELLLKWWQIYIEIYNSMMVSWYWMVGCLFG